MKTNQKLKSAPVQTTNSFSKDVLDYVASLDVLSKTLWIYAGVTTILFFAMTAAYFGKAIETIQVSSQLMNLQRSNEAMVRTCGGYPDPAYVCYGKANKTKLENLLQGAL